MPSWNDGESSEDSLLSEFDQGHDLSPRPPIPETILDLSYTGYEDCDLRCKHNMPLYKYVCFEGANTRRRFRGCKEEVLCDTVHWVDEEWPCQLKCALEKIWSMYEDERDSRIHGNVEYSTKNYQLVLQKRDLEKKNLELHKQLGDTLQYVADATSHELDVAKKQATELQVVSLKEDKKKLEFELAKRQKGEEQVARLEEEKRKLECELVAAKMHTSDGEVATLKEAKKKLEYYVADLLKVHHENKEKMKKIAKICGQ